MKTILIWICSLLFSAHTWAQLIASPVGEYMLRGEMEMAAGLKLDSNGQFAFFFIYGALDRQAHGSWRRDGDRLFLNSEPKGVMDFQLVGSKQNTGKKFTIVISGAQPELLRYVSATGFRKGKQVSETANEKGRIVLPLMQADSLLLRFEWCPEKTFRFTVRQAAQNQFSFRLLPSITDVAFENHVLTITPEEITGTLPFSGDHICHFQRVNASAKEP